MYDATAFLSLPQLVSYSYLYAIVNYDYSRLLLLTPLCFQCERYAVESSEGVSEKPLGRDEQVLRTLVRIPDTDTDISFPAVR